MDCSITTEASTNGTSLPQIDNGIDAREDKNDGQTRQLRKSKYRMKVADNKDQPGLPDVLECSITTEASTTCTSLPQIDNGIDAREDRNGGQTCQHKRSKFRKKIADNKEQPGLPDDLDCSITTEASTTGTSLPQIDNGIDARDDRNGGETCQHKRSEFRKKIADNKEQPGLPDDLDCSITTEASTTGTSLPQIDNGIDAREDKNDGQTRQLRKSKYRKQVADNKEQPALPDDLECSITTEASTTGTSLPQIDNGIDAREYRNGGQTCQHKKSKYRKQVADNKEQPGLPDDLECSITTEASTTGTSLPQIDNGIDAREDRNGGQTCQHKRSEFRKKIADNKEQPGLPDDLDCSITTEASTTGTSLPQIDNGIEAREDRNGGQTCQHKKSKYRKKVADNKEQPGLSDDLECSRTTEASTTGTFLPQIDNGIDARVNTNGGQTCQHKRSEFRKKVADNKEQPGLSDDLKCSITTEASTTGTSLPQGDNGIDAREDRNEGQMCQHEKSKHRQKIADNEEQPGIPDDLDYSITTVASTTGTSLPQIDNGIDARGDRNDCLLTPEASAPVSRIVDIHVDNDDDQFHNTMFLPFQCYFCSSLLYGDFLIAKYVFLHECTHIFENIVSPFFFEFVECKKCNVLIPGGYVEILKTT